MLTSTQWLGELLMSLTTTTQRPLLLARRHITLTHHTRRIVKAAVIGGANSVCEQITNLKQRACALATAEA